MAIGSEGYQKSLLQNWGYDLPEIKDREDLNAINKWMQGPGSASQEEIDKQGSLTSKQVGDMGVNWLIEHGRLTKKEARELRKQDVDTSLGMYLLLEPVADDPEIKEEYPNILARKEPTPSELTSFNRRIYNMPLDVVAAPMKLHMSDQPLIETLNTMLQPTETEAAVGETAELALAPQPTPEKEPEEPTTPKEDEDMTAYTGAMALGDSGDIDGAIEMLEELSKTAKSESMREQAEDAIREWRAKKGL